MPKSMPIQKKDKKGRQPSGPFAETLQMVMTSSFQDQTALRQQQMPMKPMTSLLN